MPFTLDPELRDAINSLPQRPPAPPNELTWLAIREASVVSQAALGALVEQHDSVSTREVQLRRQDGSTVAARWFEPVARSSDAAVVYAHGGGLVAGSIDQYAPYVQRYVASSGIPFLSVEYLRAPEAMNEQPARDLFSGLQCLIHDADLFGIDPSRIALLGESAGGGIAAGAAILARDAGLRVAAQILVYPMLDDRTVLTDPHLDGIANWTPKLNQIGWDALLGPDRGSDTVSPIAAPARLRDHHGLAPAYIEVGALDIFRDEDITYAQALLHAGVAVELHIHPGVTHGFEQAAPHAAVARRALADRTRMLRSL